MIKKIVILFLFFFILLFGLYQYTKTYLQTDIQTPSLLYIPQGSVKETIHSFKENGVDLHWFDHYLIRLYGTAQAGWIDVGKSVLSRESFFHQVTHAKAALQKVTLIPGETNYIFLETMAEQLDLNLTKLQRYYASKAPFKDGVIVADTYSVPRGIDEEALLKHLVETSLAYHETLAKSLLGHFETKSWFREVITKASIIQKEAANIDEMPLVSAVIDNRLKKGMKLQMDGTLNYGKYSHVAVTAKKIRENTSAFNTYKHKGLPPYPICAVNKEAINAALNPQKVDYLYFVKGKDGKHLFTKSYKEHLKNIK